MPVQVQCPNCGGYKTSSSGVRVDQNTRKRVRGSFLGFLLASLVFFVALFALTNLINFIVNQLFLKNSTVSDQYTALGIISIFAFIASLLMGIFVFAAFARKRRRILPQSVIAYHSECSLCGYTWRWDGDNPQPALQVRPDLIQKGAKKLEENAAAAYYWQQQNKKKR